MSDFPTSRKSMVPIVILHSSLAVRSVCDFENEQETSILLSTMYRDLCKPDEKVKISFGDMELHQPSDDYESHHRTRYDPHGAPNGTITKTNLECVLVVI